MVFINNLLVKNPRQIALQEIMNCDVFILTSYTTSKALKEGTPIVLMVAQAMGKPCITTWHARIPEIVKNNITGFLVKERDIVGISNAMRMLLLNPNLIKELSENAKNYINIEFNNKIQQKRLLDIYKNFIQV